MVQMINGGAADGVLLPGKFFDFFQRINSCKDVQMIMLRHSQCGLLCLLGRK